MTDDLDSFMTTMVAQSDPVPLEQALAFARERYGLEADGARLTGERDENFRLTLADGAQYVLKIANPAQGAAVVDLQVAALLHLERTEATLPCPRVLRTRDGNTTARFEGAGGVARMVHILSYLPGRLLGESVRSSRQRAACGRLAGRLSRALKAFSHPAAHRAIIWDVRHVGRLPALLGQLPRFEFRTQATELLARVVPALEARLPELRQQVVHNDLNPRNILVDPADAACVSGVIDFGDLTRTALIADVAVAGADLIPPDCADPAGALESVLDVARAYHECVPLLQPEVAILGALVAARLLMSVVVHEWHVHHNPGSRHFAPLDHEFMRAQFEIADRMLTVDIRL